MGITDILGMLVFGLVVGAICRLLVPGRQDMGILSTMLLGVAGSFIGGAIGYLISGGNVFQTSGWIGSILGGIIVLLLTVSRGRKTTLVN